jgi:hypothetical protein
MCSNIPASPAYGVYISMNPTKILIELKHYMNPTKNLIEPKLFKRSNKANLLIALVQ